MLRSYKDFKHVAALRCSGLYSSSTENGKEEFSMKRLNILVILISLVSASIYARTEKTLRNLVKEVSSKLDNTKIDTLTSREQNILKLKLKEVNKVLIALGIDVNSPSIQYLCNGSKLLALTDLGKIVVETYNYSSNCEAALSKLQTSRGNLYCFGSKLKYFTGSDSTLLDTYNYGSNCEETLTKLQEADSKLYCFGSKLKKLTDSGSVLLDSYNYSSSCNETLSKLQKTDSNLYCFGSKLKKITETGSFLVEQYNYSSSCENTLSTLN
jgi:hypothetical protein